MGQRDHADLERTIALAGGRITTMSTQIIWHGTQQESFALIGAVAHNCTCQVGPDGVRTFTCNPHRMLTEDQRALDGLLFARRMADRLLREEFARSQTARVEP